MFSSPNYNVSTYEGTEGMFILKGILVMLIFPENVLM